MTTRGGAPPGPQRKTIAKILGTLRDHGPLRVDELAKRAGISPKTFGRAVPSLRSASWLELRDDGRWAIGRAASVFAISVSRERVRCAVVDAHGGLVARASRQAMVAPLHDDPPSKNETSELFVELGRECLGQLEGGKPAAVAVAWPGTIIKTANGPRLAVASTSSWQQEFSFSELFDPVTKALGLSKRPIEFVNDADAELLAETRWGVAQNMHAAVGIKVCGGIGTAIVIDGWVHEGTDRSAGEIGHVAVDVGDLDDDERRPRAAKPLELITYCSCNLANCRHLERFASGRATIERLVVSDELASGYDQAGERLMESDRAHTDLRFALKSAGRLVGRALVGPWLLVEPDVVVVSPFPYGEAIRDGVKDELEDGVGRAVEVRLGTNPQDRGYWMTTLGAAAYGFDRHIRGRLEQRLAAG